jgi:hypothetical protein
MGFFSDPATQPSNVTVEECYALESAEVCRVARTDRKGCSKSPKRSKGGIRRTKSLDGSLVPEGPSPVHVRRNRRPHRPHRSGGNLDNSSSTDSHSSSVGMAEHLKDIEAFCKVMKSTDSKQRAQLLKESILAQEDKKNGTRRVKRTMSHK